MATQTCTHRLRKELQNIMREPPQHIIARPLPSNILHWYFLLEGPPGTPYEGGLYLGRLAFPAHYPYKPPAVYMCTPQGRFKTEQKLCLSMSDFHPETWSPLWSVSAVLTGILTFMCLDEETVGSTNTSLAEKRALARTSHTFNRTHKIVRELFPEFLNDDRPSIGQITALTVTTTTTTANNKKPLPSSSSRATKTVHTGTLQTQTHQAVAAAALGTALDNKRLRNEQERESLPSLLAWLVVFVGIVLAIFKLITRP